MTSDRGQRLLETVKLGFEYLKHLTTLSGAATLIVLAFVDRAGAYTWGLGLAVFLFALATLSCLAAMTILIGRMRHDALEAGARFSVMAVAAIAGVFTAGLATLMLFVFVPPGFPMVLLYPVVYIPIIVLFVYITSGHRSRDRLRR
jgi:putative copper export protein